MHLMTIVDQQTAACQTQGGEGRTVCFTRALHDVPGFVNRQQQQTINQRIKMLLEEPQTTSLTSHKAHKSLSVSVTW